MIKYKESAEEGGDRKISRGRRERGPGYQCTGKEE
jgi:hypothetical protein